MRNRRLALAILMVLAPISLGRAQQTAEHSRWPFLAGALSAGALGFTSQGNARPIIGTYGYAAYSRIIVGVQGGTTLGAAPSDAIYGMATLGYPAQAVRRSLVYPFVGAGFGSMHSSNGLGAATQAVYGAGVGADRFVGEGDRGLLVGVRSGYVFRPDDLGTRAIYFTMAIGAAGQPRQRSKPPVIIAGR